MPLPILSVPAFPDVPPFPGVPPIPRNPLTAAFAPQITRLLGDASIVARLLGVQATPNWGIWDTDGQAPVIIGDSVIATEFEGEWAVTDAPVELGQFNSYNRVRRPREIMVTLTKGGSVSARHDFLRLAEGALSSTVLYTVVVPEYTYPNMNVVRLQWDRSQEQGAQLIKLNVYMREIQQTAAAKFSSPQQPTGAAQVNIGSVQAVTPTKLQVQELGPAPALDSPTP